MTLYHFHDQQSGGQISLLVLGPKITASYSVDSSSDNSYHLQRCFIFSDLTLLLIVCDNCFVCDCSCSLFVPLFCLLFLLFSFHRGLAGFGFWIPSSAVDFGFWVASSGRPVMVAKRRRRLVPPDTGSSSLSCRLVVVGMRMRTAIR